MNTPQNPSVMSQPAAHAGNGGPPTGPPKSFVEAFRELEADALKECLSRLHDAMGPFLETGAKGAMILEVQKLAKDIAGRLQPADMQALAARDPMLPLLLSELLFKLAPPEPSEALAPAPAAAAIVQQHDDRAILAHQASNAAIAVCKTCRQRTAPSSVREGKTSPLVRFSKRHGIASHAVQVVPEHELEARGFGAFEIVPA